MNEASPVDQTAAARSDAWPPPTRAKSIATTYFLTLVIAGIILPLLAFSAVLLLRFAERERDHYRNEAVRVADHLLGAVDRELVGLGRALEVLSISNLLTRGEFKEFHQEASELKRSLGVDIIYKDVSGQQHANTRVPYGTPLPVSLPESDRRALQAGGLYISDLFVGATAQRLVVSLYMPVRRDGEIIGLVVMGVFPEHFASLLAPPATPAGWTGALIDRQGNIIARSRQHERFAGSQATTDLLQNATGERGTWLGSTLEGTSVQAAYARSLLSGWRVAVGVPSDMLEAPLRRSLIWLAIGGTLAFVLALSVGAYAGRQIALSMTTGALNLVRS